MARGGNVVIPSFAVGRTQELLFFLREIKAEGMVKSVPDFRVFVDSPLAVEATNIFRTKIIDFTDEAISIEATGDSQKIDAFIEYMKKFDIIEMCRTGLVALDRGGANIWSEHED
jgi:acetolactate synthase small subunit